VNFKRQKSIYNQFRLNAIMDNQSFLYYLKLFKINYNFYRLVYLGIA